VGELGGVSCCCCSVWERIYIGGLEGTLEDGDCVVLGCDIAEVLGPAID
jgi:hypothetical protein